jgi:GNAT superfamily N-acetyltransferase
MPRRSLGAPLACPRFSIATKAYPLKRKAGEPLTAIDFDLIAQNATRKVRAGYLMVDLHRPGIAEVASIDIGEDYRRCGFGTKLYEAAAAWACTQGREFRSDLIRTASSDGFWRKQAAKGRAVCAPATKAAWREATGEGLVFERGGCAYYTLTAPCPTPSLAGLKARKPR